VNQRVSGEWVSEWVGVNQRVSGEWVGEWMGEWMNGESVNE
jgi:hypothetical protein